MRWRQVGTDEEFDWAARYEPLLRALPLAAGGLGIAGVLLNRLFSGVRSHQHLLMRYDLVGKRATLPGRGTSRPLSVKYTTRFPGM